MLALSRTLILTALLMFICAGSAFAFQNLVDEIWKETEPNLRANCRNFVVQAGPPQVLRGKISGHECLKHAVKAYRDGDHEEAFGWILAGQCQNREVRQTLVSRAPKVLEYLLKQYGAEVP